MLSGKHQSGPAPEGTRFTLGRAGEMYQGRYWHAQAFETVEQLRPIADDTGMSMVQLAVAWTLANPAITAPIIGASKPEQLADSLKAADTVMPTELKRRLDEVTVSYRMGDAAR